MKPFHTRWLILLAVAMPLGGLACNCHSCGVAEEQTEEQPTAVAAAQDTAWGTIKGTIIWGGAEIPKQGVIKLPAGDAAALACIKANKGKFPPNEEWVVNKENKGIRNTFVWLLDANKKALPINPKLKDVSKLPAIEVDQPACHFIPHALAVREGQKLIVKNSSPFPHSFRYTGGPDNQGNFIIPSGGQHDVNLKADRLPIKIDCTIHPWMNGWVRCYDHPYFAVTDENGAFEIKDAPAGNWRLMVWHGSAGWKDGAKGRNGDPFAVKGAAVTDLGKIVFPPPAN